MPKRKSNLVEMPPKPQPQPVEQDANPAPVLVAPDTAPVPLFDIPELATNLDFYDMLDLRRQLSEQRSAIAKTESQYKGTGVGLALALSEAGVKSVDLGDGTILQWIGGPGPITGDMVKELVQDLLRAGVDVAVLKAAVGRMDEARRAASWFSVKFVKAVCDAQ